MTDIRLKRVYEDVESGDGERVLVERLWPRGVSKQDERVTRWFKEIAPTNDLRRWFHETGEFADFSKAYRKELQEREDAREALNELTRIVEDADAVTLVFASKNQERNSAVILKDILQSELQR